MAEAGLFIRWGEVARGREKGALQVFNEGLQYFGRLQQEGEIESFELVVFMPHSPDDGGFVLLRGSAQQIDAVRRDEEFRRLINRARLRIDGFGVADTFVDEGVAQVINLYQEEVEKLD